MLLTVNIVSNPNHFNVYNLVALITFAVSESMVSDYFLDVFHIHTEITESLSKNSTFLPPSASDDLKSNFHHYKSFLNVIIEDYIHELIWFTSLSLIFLSTIHI